MKVGIYVTSLTPKGASQGRFQSCVFEGLRQQSDGRHQFVVLSDHIPAGQKNVPPFTYVELQREGVWKRLRDLARRAGGKVGALLFRLTGAPHSSLALKIKGWAATEPAYYDQLKELDVRIIWNVSGHELRSWLPNIKTVWDVNHRIHTLYPEFSYTRYTFDGLDIPLISALPRAAYIITGTEEGKRQVVSMFGVSEYKVRVIPFPTPPLPELRDDLAPNVQFPTAAPYVFYPARLWPHKNHAVVIAALQVLRERWGLVINCVFSGADEGNLNHILAYAQASGVADQIRHVGQVEEAELVRLYRHALALVYASAVGPDNLPPLEAMSLDCPAIIAEVPGSHEQFGDSTLYFPPTDHETLAALIRRVATDEGERRTLVERGRIRAKKWSVQDYAGGIVEILDEFALHARAWGKNDQRFT